MKLPLKVEAYEVYDADNNLIADCGLIGTPEEMLKNATAIASALNEADALRAERDAAIQSARSATEAMQEIVIAVHHFNQAQEKYLDEATAFGTPEEEEALKALEAAEKRLDDLLTLHYHLITTGEPFKPKP